MTPTPEMFCLFCSKHGHLTNECHSTIRLSTPEARESMRLAHLANEVLDRATAVAWGRKGTGRALAAWGELPDTRYESVGDYTIPLYLGATVAPSPAPNGDMAKALDWFDAFTLDRCGCVFATSQIMGWISDLNAGNKYTPGPGAASGASPAPTAGLVGFLTGLAGSLRTHDIWWPGTAYADALAKECEKYVAILAAGASPEPTARMLGYELAGVIADVEQGNGFDPTCLETIKRVRAALAVEIPQKHSADPVASGGTLPDVGGTV